jgi:hypothetical protein
MEEKLEDIIVGALLEHFAPEDLQTKFDLLRERVNEAAMKFVGVDADFLRDEKNEDSDKYQHFYTTYSYMLSKVLIKAADKLTYVPEIDA